MSGIGKDARISNEGTEAMITNDELRSIASMRNYGVEDFDLINRMATELLASRAVRRKCCAT